LRILHLAKRHYTNKDALTERFGRVYQLPRHWAASGARTSLALLDYRSLNEKSLDSDGFSVRSLPALDPRSPFRLCAMATEFRPDIVIASGDCFIGLAGLYLARRNNARFVLDAYDDYSTFGGYRAFLGWNAFGYLLDNADAVLYASRSLADRHSAKSPWLLAPNGVDATHFHPISTSAARSNIGLDVDDRILVGYLGSMEPDRGVDDLIAAVGMLHEEDQRIHLLLCGTLRSDMKPLPTWVDYCGVVPHASVVNYINACDVVALPYRRSQLMDMGASCKIAEYLLCQRPIAATRTPNFLQNFPEQASQLDAVLAMPGDVDELARTIQRQLDDPVMAQSPSDMTWQQIAERLMTNFQQLFGQRQDR